MNDLPSITLAAPFGGRAIALGRIMEQKPLHVTQSRRTRIAVAAAALITVVASGAGIGTAAAAHADPAATVAPNRYQEGRDMFTALQFPTLGGDDSDAAGDAEGDSGSAGSDSADQGAPAAAEGSEATPAEEVVAEPAPAPAPPPPPPAVTADDLARIVPGISPEKIAAYIAPLNDAMIRGGIDNPVRKAAFLAQLAVESDSFRTFEEYASGSAYEWRSDLGNTQPGDGVRYKGRGAIQITGRHNYQKVSEYTGVDFVAHPELLAAPEYAFTTAVWYWTSRNLNHVADTAGIVRVSELVNGGHHALSRRIADFQRGLDVLIRH